jgi:hypothetical protein
MTCLYRRFRAPLCSRHDESYKQFTGTLLAFRSQLSEEHFNAHADGLLEHLFSRVEHLHDESLNYMGRRAFRGTPSFEHKGTVIILIDTLLAFLPDLDARRTHHITVSLIDHLIAREKAFKSPKSANISMNSTLASNLLTR